MVQIKTRKGQTKPTSVFGDIYRPQNNSDIPQDDTLFSWQAPEFEFVIKDVMWYWLSLIAGLILVFIAVWQKNFLFIIFIVLAEILIFSWAEKVPKIWKFSITGKGIKIGENKFYPFREIASFDIHEYSEEFSEVVFKMRGKFHPYLKIFIHSEDSGEIEKIISRFLRREELIVSLADVVGRIIGF